MEKEFKEIVKTLKEAKRLKYIRDFALTGALALLQPRATLDMDFLASMERPNIPRFVDWLKYNKRYTLVRHHAGRPKDAIKNLIEVPSGNTWADIIASSCRLEEEAVSTASSISPLKGVKIKVVRPEYLLILKARGGSPQDYVDCAGLWNEPIDKKLVKRLAKEFFMETRLKKVISIAKKTAGK